VSTLYIVMNEPFYKRLLHNCQGSDELWIEKVLYGGTGITR